MRRKIKIVPILHPPYFIIEEIKNNLENIFNYSVCIDKSLQPKNLHKNFIRNQYYASKLINYLKETDIDDADKVLGVISEDIFDEGYNFLLGSAELGGKYSIISIFRLYDEDTNKFVDRSVKEAIHEIGHTHGLRHCIDKRCVMNFSLSVSDVDKKEKIFVRFVKLK